MNKILIDSNFFIALFNPQDSLHEKAKNIGKRIEKGQHQLFISNFIFLEIVTVLSQRAGKARALKYGLQLYQGQWVTLLHITEQLNYQSWQIFNEIRKKNTSFVDCSSLAVMNAEGINKFLTFDQEDFTGLRKNHKFSFF